MYDIVRDFKTTYARQNYTYEYRYKYTNVGYEYIGTERCACAREYAAATARFQWMTKRGNREHGMVYTCVSRRTRADQETTREPTRGDRVPYHASDFLHFSFLVLKTDDTRSPKVSPASSFEGTIDFRGEVASPRNLCPPCPHISLSLDKRLPLA